MPEPTSQSDLKQGWQAFVRSLRSLFSGLSEHRHQDQYMAARQAAFDLAEGAQMADEIESGYRNAATRVANEKPPRADAAEIVAMEVRAFPVAVQVHADEEKAGSAKPDAAKRLRAAGKTILGSVKDVFKLSDFGTAVITVMEEAIDLAGKD